MLKNFSILFLLVFISCNTTKITYSWKNPNYINYEPKKILILGITPNLEAKTIYEHNLKEVFTIRNIEAFEASKILKPTFSTIKQANLAIENQVANLKKLGFDTIILATIKGYEERVPLDGAIFKLNDSFFGFENYYYLNQDIYYERDYYEKFKVFHLEVSLYNLTSTNEKALVWIGTYDIVNPKKIKKTINKCVRKISKTLEEEGVFPKLI